MKTNFSTLLIFLSMSGAMAQQQQESFPHRYIGLGIRIAGIQLSDLTSRAYPTNRLVLAIDPHKYFRLEGQYGFFSTSSEEVVQANGTGYTKFELHGRSTFAGVGAMAMYPKDRGRFIAGVRYGINKYSDEHVSTASGPIEVNKGKMTLLSGMIGGEYFLARFFSIGAEFSVSSVKDVYDVYSTTDKKTFTEGNLVLRFYLF